MRRLILAILAILYRGGPQRRAYCRKRRAYGRARWVQRRQAYAGRLLQDAPGIGDCQRSLNIRITLRAWRTLISPYINESGRRHRPHKFKKSMSLRHSADSHNAEILNEVLFVQDV